MSTNGADIQIENGEYTRIHNTILEKLIAAKLSTSELKLVLFLLRKTYGWNKKEDTLSYGQIAAAINIDRRNAISTVRSLAAKRVINIADAKLGRNGCQTYSFNKYFEQWTCLTNGDAGITNYDGVNGDAGDTINPVNGDAGITNYGEMVMLASLEMVMPASPTKDSKESGSTSLVLPTTDALTAQFITAYRKVWALVPASEYEVGKLTDWAGRVTLEAWEYALAECADRGRVGNWKYLETILRRVEREGVQTKRNGSAPIAAPVVDIAKPEVKAWQI